MTNNRELEELKANVKKLEDEIKAIKVSINSICVKQLDQQMSSNQLFGQGQSSLNPLETLIYSLDKRIGQ